MWSWVPFAGGGVVSWLVLLRLWNTTWNTTLYYTLAIGGKALAGWPDPYKPVYPPSCDAITATMSPPEVDQFHLFLRTLFNALHYNIIESPLRSLALCMWASFLHCGEDHVVITTMKSVAKRFDYLPRLRDWGVLVAADWK